MTFTAIPPSNPPELFGNAWTIYASGEIDEDAPKNFERLLLGKKIPQQSSVYFNSPGGNLAAAMELGRLIRRAGFYTNVMAQGELDREAYFRIYKNQPAVCMSVCTLAYLGGVFRFLDDRSKYGVHRFFSMRQQFDSDAAQVVSSVIVQYIREMGADPNLFSQMTRAGKDEINVLTRPQLEALRVVTGGTEDTRWTIESTGSIVYLKGERNTARGINKFIVYCDHGRPILHVIFDPLNRDEVVRLKAQSLMIDDKPFPIAPLQIGTTQLINGWINAHYALSPDLTQAIRSANTVGIAFQVDYGAPFFMGFSGMPLGQGRQKFQGLLANCKS